MNQEGNAPTTVEESPNEWLNAWLRLQSFLAEKTELALMTLDSTGEPVKVSGPDKSVSNNNSICEAMMASPEHAPLCALDCGRAYRRAVSAGGPAQFRCHAGLHCFTLPVCTNEGTYAVLGGRAFRSSSEYRTFLRRYNDLQPVADGRALTDIKFSSRKEFDTAANLVASVADFRLPDAAPDGPVSVAPQAASATAVRSNERERVDDQIQPEAASWAWIYEVLREAADAIEPSGGYTAVLLRLMEIMKAERASLMVLDEQSDRLVLQAAAGFDPPSVRLKPGEGIAGGVLEKGRPLIVADARRDWRTPKTDHERYKSNSFISFPIFFGARKLAVINLAGRTDGVAYDDRDGSVLEMIAPHLALIIDRTEWHRKAARFQQMSLTDPLTGLANRRYLEQRLDQEVERSKRYAMPLCFMLIDIDGFKAYNDTHGHNGGDRVLVQISHILRRSVRTIDMPARLGGDEFCVILPETELAAASVIADRLCFEVERTKMQNGDGDSLGKVTVSIGVSAFHQVRQNSQAIFDAADSALYQAKRLGRNCVVLYDPHQTAVPDSPAPGSRQRLHEDDQNDLA